MCRWLGKNNDLLIKVDEVIKRLVANFKRVIKNNTTYLTKIAVESPSTLAMAS